MNTTSPTSHFTPTPLAMEPMGLVPRRDLAQAAPDALLLQPGTIRRWPARMAVLVRVLSGRVWITQSGDGQDHFLTGGQTITLPAGGRVVIESEGRLAALLRVERIAARPWYRGRGLPGTLLAGWPSRWWARAGWVRDLVTRPVRQSSASDAALSEMLSSLSEHQLRDIGAPGALIQEARARALARGRWIERVLFSRDGSW